jgi:hypothetical protein
MGKMIRKASARLFHRHATYDAGLPSSLEDATLVLMSHLEVNKQTTPELIGLTDALLTVAASTTEKSIIQFETRKIQKKSQLTKKQYVNISIPSGLPAIDNTAAKVQNRKRGEILQDVLDTLCGSNAKVGKQNVVAWLVEWQIQGRVLTRYTP